MGTRSLGAALAGGGAQAADVGVEPPHEISVLWEPQPERGFWGLLRSWSFLRPLTLWAAVPRYS